MPSKSLALAAIGLATTVTLAPAEASAGDPALGALVGGAFGAAIGHGVNGHDGAIVGGLLGAVAGAGIAASTHPHDAQPAYYPPAPVRYAPSMRYYPVAPVYYAPPVVVTPRPVVVAPRPVVVVPRHPAVHRPLPYRPVYVAPVVVHRHPGGYWR